MSYSAPPEHNPNDPYAQYLEPKKKDKKPLLWTLLGVVGVLAVIGLIFMVAVGIGVGKELKSSETDTGEESPSQMNTATTAPSIPQSSGFALNPKGNDMFGFQTDDGTITIAASFGKEPPQEYVDASSVSGMSNRQWLVICSAVEPGSRAYKFKAMDVKLETSGGQYATYLEKQYWIGGMKKSVGDDPSKLAIIEKAEKVHESEGGFDPADYQTEENNNQCNWLLQASSNNPAEPYSGYILGTTESGNTVKIDQYYE